ncbi:MAG: beta-mannosidase [Armatimonadota bacterium]|nr:MAG: beta-mannosidase [Armatimonadota bacterium]
MLLPSLAIALAVASPASATVGVVDSSLVEPYEWTRGDDAAAWRAEACVTAFDKAGFSPRILDAGALTADGLSSLQVIVIPGDHVYPERGDWGGPILRALADFVRAGGVYVMPVGVSHYVARDMATGVRDTGHFGPDALGLSFEVSSGAGPVSLTSQGRALGLPDPGPLSATPIRSLRTPGPMAILAWDSRYTPAVVAVPVGKGFVIHCGCGENMDAAFAEWWYRAAAAAARAAVDGKLRPMTMQETFAAEGIDGLSLDDLDRRAFSPASSPLDSPATEVTLQPGSAEHPRGPVRLSLDGKWEMVGCDTGRGSESTFLGNQPWPDAIRADIPCSVHTALLAAGRIPDPMIGLHADIARKACDREWWFRRRFTRPEGMTAARLYFDGVDYSCTVWLNGERLGRHEGAFGGPDFDVGDLLHNNNALVVRLDPVPADWKLVLKTNVVYGWHYVNLPSLGIWRSVRLEGRPTVDILDPFVAARDAQKGIVDLCVTLRGLSSKWSGTLRGTIEPENFAGEPLRFEYNVRADSSEAPLHLRFHVPDARLWWPVDLGPQNLYRLTLSFIPTDGAPDTEVTTFGIRTIETRPLPGGPLPMRYRWTFIINGRPIFLKGANWCILDPLLRLDSARYERFLGLARNSHIQLLRAWGGGLLETDVFYDLCDRLGVMVYQEFPLTWQRFDVLSPSVVDETATGNVRRLRNHPSLLMWGGGNEHSGEGPIVKQIGRICLELDGSRPFHRTDPYGGSLHNYDVYWGRQPLDRNLSLAAPFIGEFGLSSPPNLESVLRYLPPDERTLWPPPAEGSFVRHTPTYSAQHLDIMHQYASQFRDADTMDGLITGMQLAQATGLRHTLELARTRWPEATGVCYYKLTDVYPACAWATVDWYGVPKIAYFFTQDAYEPLHACALFERLAVPEGEGLRVPIFLLDDAEELTGEWSVLARAFGASLREVARTEFNGIGLADRVRRLGDLTVSAQAAGSAPLLIVTEARAGRNLRDRTFYWLNVAARPGCLFDLPQTRLATRVEGGNVVVENAGSVPAVGVHFYHPEGSDRLSVEDSYFWLDPGEARVLQVSDSHAVRVRAWNAPATMISEGKDAG